MIDEQFLLFDVGPTRIEDCGNCGSSVLDTKSHRGDTRKHTEKWHCLKCGKVCRRMQEGWMNCGNKEVDWWNYRNTKRKGGVK